LIFYISFSLKPLLRAFSARFLEASIHTHPHRQEGFIFLHPSRSTLYPLQIILFICLLISVKSIEKMGKGKGGGRGGGGKGGRGGGGWKGNGRDGRQQHKYGDAGWEAQYRQLGDQLRALQLRIKSIAGDGTPLYMPPPPTPHSA
jgi:hypothetical protein